MTDGDYYVLVNGEETGPFTLGQLDEMLRKQEITLETYYAQPGMSEWVPLSKNEPLLERFAPELLPNAAAKLCSVELREDAGQVTMDITGPLKQVIGQALSDVLDEQGIEARVVDTSTGQRIPPTQDRQSPPCKTEALSATDVALREAGIEIEDGWLRSKQPSFFGQCCRSPDGRFILAWRDAVYATEGNWIAEEGKYLLLDGATVICEGTLRRPQDGKVANNGNFILSDWEDRFFYALSASGEILIQKQFDSVGEPKGISDEGGWAVTGGYVADEDLDEADRGEPGDVDDAAEALVGQLQYQGGSELWLFDLEQRTLRTHFKTRLGSPCEFRFDRERQILYVIYTDGLTHRYSFDGGFLDLDAWKRQCPEYANGYQLLFAAEAELRQVRAKGIEAYSGAIELLQSALAKGVSEFTQAKIHRHLGEIHDLLGEKQKALGHLETALRLNPKIGVKKKVARLKADCQQDR